MSIKRISKVSGRWCYSYRAVDQDGQVIDVMLSKHRDAQAAHRLFARALLVASAPVEVVTDKARAFPAVIDELAPQAFHNTEKCRQQG